MDSKNLFAKFSWLHFLLRDSVVLYDIIGGSIFTTCPPFLSCVVILSFCINVKYYTRTDLNN